MALPKPVGRQREVLYLPAKGHFVVLGTAGSGKTTLAILRAAYLAYPGTPHQGRTLLVTFNRTLVAYLNHLKEQSLEGVDIVTYHQFARGYLHSQGMMCRNAICGPNGRETLIRAAVERVSSKHRGCPLFDRPGEFFSEEVRWLAQHGIQSLEEYEEAVRIGRSGTRLDRRLRSILYEVYETYRDLRSSSGRQYDWDDIATAVCKTLDMDQSPRLYRHVVIDEGQDFSPEMIRSLAKAIPNEGSLTLFADFAQQIYGTRMSWRSAGLSVEKVWTLKDNYRNTKQIARLALAIASMPYFRGIPDLVEPVAPTADGPPPTMVKCPSAEAEAKFVISQARQASKTQSVAILFRTREVEASIARLLPSNSYRLDRKLQVWRAGTGIWHGTYHSAKGLEFDTVIIPFLSNESFPDPGEVAAHGEEETKMRDGKLLYVGVTRARTRLIISFTGEVTRLLPSHEGLYERVELK